MTLKHSDPDPVVKINNVALSKASGPTDSGSPSAYNNNTTEFNMMGLDFTDILFNGAISNFMLFLRTNATALDTAKIFADTDGTTAGMGDLTHFFSLGETDYTKRDKFNDPVPEGFAFRATQGTSADGATLTTAANGGTTDFDIAEGFYDLFDVEVENQFHNTALITSLVPASDFQYSWINNSVSGSANWRDDQKIYGYAPRNGIVSSSVGFTEAIVFPSSSALFGED